jgi:hypothetical protein
MAALLRSSGDELSAERGFALPAQQTMLTAAMRKYEDARKQYVRAVMGQVAGLSAMGLRVQ